MPDIITLLPDSIANQIAAGEVIQRPASLVKELLENSVDAGSTEIKLIIKDAGKTLVQVVDNGKGMSEVDARMCFERHATSKIKNAGDLFSIRTKGFRGEALASIAAIAHVELKTMQEGEELGRLILVEGSEVKKQEATSMTRGTSIAVKNLFYNVPARRKFLKTDSVELKHILAEFQHVALAHPEIFFSCHHNGQDIYHLPASKLKQRIINLLGKNLLDKIIPIEEKSEFVHITGFVGKPDYTKKRMPEQYFFLNKRYIRSPYLAHAVSLAYDRLIPDDQKPFFVIFLELDPAKVDINVHPTKQEVKFEEERLIYNYVKVCVKQALGKYTLTPTLDFELDFQGGMTAMNRSRGSGFPGVSSSSSSGSSGLNFSGPSRPSKEEVQNWENLHKNIQADGEGAIVLRSKWDEKDKGDELELKQGRKPSYQLHGRYILSHIKNGMLMIDQHAAHERILYERFLKHLQSTKNATQQALFPETIELDNAKAEVFTKIVDKLNNLGFKIEKFGGNTFVIQGTPSNLDSNVNPKELVETFMDHYLSNVEFQLGIEDNIARSLSQCTSIHPGKALQPEEMQALIDQLFACEMPYKSPSGHKCFIEMKLEDIKKLFNK